MRSLRPQKERISKMSRPTTHIKHKYKGPSALEGATRRLVAAVNRMQARLTSVGDDYLIHPRTMAEDPRSGDLDRATEDCRIILAALETARKGLDKVVSIEENGGAVKKPPQQNRESA